jgi:hypothetical protein
MTFRLKQRKERMGISAYIVKIALGINIPTIVEENLNNHALIKENTG